MLGTTIDFLDSLELFISSKMTYSWRPKIVEFAFAVLGVAFRLLDNYLVPKHEIVPKEQVEELLKRLGTDAKKLPKFIVDDPIIAEIEAKPGDVIKITRFSHTAGKAVYFRIVEQ